MKYFKSLKGPPPEDLGHFLILSVFFDSMASCFELEMRLGEFRYFF
jgi:hypothetical protein